MKEIVVERFANSVQQFDVDVVFFKNLIDIGARAAYLTRKPCGCPILSFHFISYKRADVYVHDSVK